MLCITKDNKKNVDYYNDGSYHFITELKAATNVFQTTGRSSQCKLNKIGFLNAA